MAPNDRFKRLFELPKCQYLEGSPLMLQAGALLLDQQSGRCIAQLKFANVSPKTVTGVKVHVDCLDMEGISLGVSEASYPDLSCAPGRTVGDRIPIFLSHNNTRSIRVNITTVVTEDGQVWKNEWQWAYEPLPEQKGHTLSEDALQEYRQEVHETGRKESAVGCVQQAKGLWQCGCGMWNGQQEEKCLNCGLKRSWQQENYDESVLLPRLEERRRREAAAREQAAEAARLKAEKEEQERMARQEAEIRHREEMKKRNQKIAVIAGIAAAVLAVILVIMLIIVPNAQRKKAEELILQDSYDQAWEMFLKADGDDANWNFRTALQKRAQQLLEEENYAQAAAAYQAGGWEKLSVNCRYQQALTLAEHSDFDGAFSVLSALDEYAENNEELRPEDIRRQVYALQSLNLAQSGDFDGALQALEMAGVDGEGNRAAVLSMQADALAALGDYQGALDVLAELPAEEKAEQEKSIRHAWADVCEADGDYEKAESVLRGLSDEESADRMAQLRFAWVDQLQREEQYEQALSVLSQVQGYEAEKHSREAALRNAWADLCLKKNDYPGAVDALMDMRDDAEIDARYRALRYEWAAQCAGQEDYEGAINALLTLIDADARAYRIALQQSWVDQLQGEDKYEKALDVASQIADNAESQRVIRIVRENWANHLYGKAQYEQALEVIKELTGAEFDSLRSEIAAAWENAALSEGNHSATKRMYAYLGQEQLAAYYAGRALEDQGKVEEAAAQYKLAGDTLDAADCQKNVWYTPLYNARKGKEVYYGKKSGGMIKWKVLDVQGNKALLICQETLGEMQHTKEADDIFEDEDYNWEDSLIREYLNGEFLNKQLSVEERQLVIEVKLDNEREAATWDKVFLLSESEAEEYGLVRKFVPDGQKDAVDWWLRTLGYDWSDYPASVEFVGKDGWVKGGISGDWCTFRNHVRPAMWITLPKEGETLQDVADRDMKADYEAGVAAMQKGDYRAAVTHFAKVLSYADANALYLQCYELLGDLQMQAGQYADAASVYESAGNTEKMYAARGFEWLNQHDTAQAMFFFALAGDAHGADVQLAALQRQMLDDAAVGDTVFLGHAVETPTDVIVPQGGKLVSGAIQESYSARERSVALDGCDLLYGSRGNYYVEKLDDVRGTLDFIPWIVVAEDQESLMLISKSAVTQRAYHDTWEEVAYEDSDIHAWLNGTFLDQAFNETEKGFLQPDAEVMLPSMQEYFLLREWYYYIANSVTALSRDAGESKDFIKIFDGYGGYIMESGELSAVPEVYVNTEGAVYAVIRVQKSEPDPTPVPTAEPVPAPEKESSAASGKVQITEGDASQPLNIHYTEDGRGVWQCNGEALWINKQILNEIGFEMPGNGDETMSLIYMMYEWGMADLFGAENADELLQAFRAYFEATAAAENAEGYMLNLTRVMEERGFKADALTSTAVFLTTDPVELMMEHYEPLILFYSADEFTDTQMEPMESEEQAAAPALSDAERSEYTDKLMLLTAAGMTDDPEFKTIFDKDPEYFSMIFAEMGLEIPD